MKTHDCSLACNGTVLLTTDMRDKLHSRCPCAYRDAGSGEIQLCECICHYGNGDDVSDYSGREDLPVLQEAVSGPPPSPGEKDRPRARVAPPGPATGRVCGCGCGSAVARRFLPGHDAKLKSRLVKEARSGSEAAKENLREHGWEHFI